MSISTGAALVIIGADSALNWVLENHADRCDGCPPIKAINNPTAPPVAASSTRTPRR